MIEQFDGEDDSGEDFEAWHEALPSLTLTVLVSRTGTSGPQTVGLCSRVPMSRSSSWSMSKRAKPRDPKGTSG